MTLLVTGALGSVGVALMERLRGLGHDPVGTDLETMDVTNEQQVRLILERRRPSVIFHLAGAKHAPEGELDPWHVSAVNTIGTRNVLAHAGDAKVIFVSTCKACDPETAYGASKLIAERMVLNAGGVVIRYFNIPEAGGNVFRLWEQLPPEAPIPWTDCWRYFATLEQCVDLTVAALELPSGRYIPRVEPARHMRDVAAQLYPGRELVNVPRRRGDRFREPFVATCETYTPGDGWLRVTGPHDPPAVSAAISEAA